MLQFLCTAVHVIILFFASYLLLHSYWGGRIIDNLQIDNQNLQIDNLQMTGYQFVGNQFVENWSGYLFPGITSSLGTPKKERKKKE